MSSFQAAQDWVAASRAPASQQTKLRLYSLFKIATTSPAPSASRPALWDFAGRAKWDSWSALGREAAFAGPDGRANAERAYEEEARRMGWQGMEGEASRGEGEEEDGLEGVGKGSGMKRGKKEVGERMVHVSQMADEEEEEAPPSALHDLALAGDATGLRAFLATDAGRASSINAPDAYGFTPLQLATDRGHLEAVKALISAGAEMDLKDEDGNTALELALACGHDDIAAFLQAA